MGKRPRIIENINVIDIADKGQAIGKTEEGEVVILYGGVVPGDVVSMSYAKKKKGLRHGYLHEFISKSEDRVTAQCNHFGVCGGCKWQNLHYAKQVAYKESAVKAAIKRIAQDDPDKVGKIRAAREIYHYRNKLEYTFSTKRWLTSEEIKSGKDFANRPGLGFHIAGAFDKVLDIEKCHLQDDLSNKIRIHLRDLAIKNNWSFYDIRNNHGFLRNIIIRNSTSNQWMIILIFGEDNNQLIDNVLTKMIEAFPQIDSWNYMINSKQNSSYADLEVFHAFGKSHIEERLGDITYRISPKSFFQTNSTQAKVLYDTAMDLMEISEEDIVYDLYTGTGSIALYLAQKCQKVIGIEVIAEAIEDAKINADINQIENATFLVGDVKDVLEPSFHLQYGKPDVVVTDPPRAGMHEDVIKTLLQLAAPKILYISCNPSFLPVSILRQSISL